MVAIVRTEWSGTSGGPGLTQLALLGAAGGIWNPGGEQVAVDAVRAFWQSMVAFLPDELRLQVNPTVDVYDTGTGELIGSNTAGTAPAVVAGTSSASYAGGAGAKITWATGSIRDGRRVRGSTFIVPISSSVYTAVGTIGTATITSVNNASATLISALTTGTMSLAVWSRPREATETLPARSGLAYDVESGSLGTKTAILRGRRD